MTRDELQRLIDTIVSELMAVSVRPQGRCACHAVLDDCCPDRLRGVVKPITRAANVPPPREASADRRSLGEGGYGSLEGESGRLAPHDAAEILGGEWRESRGRKFLVVDRKYSPGYRHGRVSVADCLPPWARFELLGGTNGQTLFLDLVAAFNAHGINSNDIPAKLEGLSFGPDVTIDGVVKHTLFVSNDNDFITQNGYQAGAGYRDASGVEVDTMLLAYRVTLPEQMK